MQDLSPDEKERLESLHGWVAHGMAYALEHGTRPATLGLALSTSPLALLAWYV